MTQGKFHGCNLQYEEINFSHLVPKQPNGKNPEPNKHYAYINSTVKPSPTTKCNIICIGATFSKMKGFFDNNSILIHKTISLKSRVQKQKQITHYTKLCQWLHTLHYFCTFNLFVKHIFARQRHSILCFGLMKMKP